MEKTNRTEQSLRTKWMYWGRSVANLLRMGHCAPTVMKTLLEVLGTEKEWLIKLSAGMPGGIGNTGFECGALTSPLILMGLRYGLHARNGSLPVIFERGHALCQHFLACHQTFHCKQIRGKDRFPKHCIRPVCLSPQLFLASLSNHSQTTILLENRKSYLQIYSHWAKENYHCARAVFGHLGYSTEGQQELFDAVSAFMGGTLFMGMTCSAFAAGVMAVGLQSGEVEDSPQKVVRMLFRMTFGGNAFDENINKFNRSMNTGHRMSKWFTKEFGSTQCQAITQCDFSAMAGVTKYIRSDHIIRCKHIAKKVAGEVERTLVDLGGVRSALPNRSSTLPFQI